MRGGFAVRQSECTVGRVYTATLARIHQLLLSCRRCHYLVCRQHSPSPASANITRINAGGEWRWTNGVSVSRCVELALCAAILLFDRLNRTAGRMCAVALACSKEYSLLRMQAHCFPSLQQSLSPHPSPTAPHIGSPPPAAALPCSVSRLSAHNRVCGHTCCILHWLIAAPAAARALRFCRTDIQVYAAIPRLHRSACR